VRNFKEVFVKEMGLKSLTFLGEGFFEIRVIKEPLILS
jgi:hypothetical protein